MDTTTTKRIAHDTGLTVTDINAAARDLGIANWEPNRRSWTVPTNKVADLTAHLTENN